LIARSKVVVLNIFIEQKIRLGMVLGWLPILKKKSFGPIGGSFFMFSGAKKIFSFLKNIL
jgi:hypothetical protein